MAAVQFVDQMPQTSKHGLLADKSNTNRVGNTGEAELSKGTVVQKPLQWMQTKCFRICVAKF
ncbi:hypothetical protein HY17_10725 [Hyphomonas sp. CY54-11-8]|nr:hypothetical protein HY17_10725 [Hyphomonas sp. CY54-11-8]